MESLSYRKTSWSENVGSIKTTYHTIEIKDRARLILQQLPCAAYEFQAVLSEHIGR